MPLADHDDEWEVEAVKNSMKRAGETWYLLQWKGWPKEYTSWEPASSCEDAKELIDAYEAQAGVRRPSRRRKTVER